jgi:hypothetical protein
MDKNGKATIDSFLAKTTMAKDFVKKNKYSVKSVIAQNMTLNQRVQGSSPCGVTEGYQK